MIATRRRRIGLLGGSFNPAHDGHRDISLLALARLRLDAVWWLVSPQNPLKPVQGMAPLAQRLVQARHAARHPRIIVTDLESHLGTVHTNQTLRALERRRLQARFVWLMGADNLIDIARWQCWEDIFHTLPIAVFDRPGYSLAPMIAKAAKRFAIHRVPEADAGLLAVLRPPAWSFIHGPLNPLSATGLRGAAPPLSTPKP